MVDAALAVPCAAGIEFGLPASAVEALRGVLAQYGQIRRALVYGSRAKGNYRSGSDIDIVLDAPALAFADLMRIETEIDDLMLPWQVDLSLLSQIENQNLLDHIERVGKALWIKQLC